MLLIILFHSSILVAVHRLASSAILFAIAGLPGVHSRYLEKQKNHFSFWFSLVNIEARLVVNFGFNVEVLLAWIEYLCLVHEDVLAAI